jgi:hypothetical protein
VFPSAAAVSTPGRPAINQAVDIVGSLDVFMSPIPQMAESRHARYELVAMTLSGPFSLMIGSSSNTEMGNMGKPT